MIEEFTRRRGYDPRPWLPVLTGRVVESAEASDRFLWDFRRTLADMLAEYHYDQITTLLKARGMGHYGESHEGGRAFVGDGMEVKRTNDVPMSRDVDAAPGRQRRAARLQRRHPRVGLGRAPLRADPRGRGVPDGRLRRLGVVPGDAQAHRRQGCWRWA